MQKRSNEVKLLLRGFDAIIKPSDEESAYNVTLYEGGRQVSDYDVFVDFDKFEGSDKDMDGEDDIYEYAANAAIDWYESDRGTLGLGAGAMDKKSYRKNACYLSAFEWENWFMCLKGTPFEAQAIELFRAYIEEYHSNMARREDEQIKALTFKVDDLYHQLDKIALEYILGKDPHQTVIVVQAGMMKTIDNADDVQELLDTFSNTRWEGQVIDIIREILQTNKQISSLYAEQPDHWARKSELEAAMRELSIAAVESHLQTNVISQMPEMLEDLVELAAGVDFSEPLEPEVFIFDKFSRKRAYQDNEPEEKEDFGLSMVVDAEEEADIKFTVNQEVSLNKKIEVPLWGGSVEELPSGTKGVIETAYDNIGSDYLFRSEDGITVRVNKDDLKKKG